MSSDSDSDSKKKLGSRKRGVSDMFRTSYRTHIELSAIADNKSNIMISINGIIISIIIASISPKIDSNPWLLLPTSILLVTCLVALIYAVLSARPRVSKEKVTLEDVRENKLLVECFDGEYKSDFTVSKYEYENYRRLMNQRITRAFSGESDSE